MQVLIVGGGKVGSHLAKTLSANGDSVTIVEVSEERCTRLHELLENVTIICGDGDEPYVLDEATPAARMRWWRRRVTTRTTWWCACSARSSTRRR